MTWDATTIQPQRDRDDEAVRLVPIATIAWHPDPSRIGEQLAFGEVLELGRTSPEFLGGPLADPHVSRKPVRIAVGRDVRVTPHPQGSVVRVDGRRGEATLPLDTLDTGVVVEIADRVVLVVHRAEDAEAPEDLGMVGRGMDAVRRQILQVADLDVSVLIRGQTGTGKERVAQAIHHRSPRSGRPFVAVNLAALTPSTAVAELFGHARGAFTGADRDRVGLFGRADGGTLFLDEVGEAPAEVQVALLRVLETGELHRLGDPRPTKVDVRVLAATDADLEAAVASGEFREPLLHRLAGFEVSLPPLASRRVDIGPLLAHFLRLELDALGETDKLDLSGPAAEPWFPVALASELIRADWPGNVRQLRNVVRQLVIASRGRDRVVRTPAVDRLLTSSPSAEADSAPSDDLDETSVRAALEAAAFRPSVAAKNLGCSKTTLYAWIDRLGLPKAKDLTAADLDGARDATGGDLDAMAQRLQVSRRGLVLRIGELGWS